MTDIGNETAVASALLTLTEQGAIVWEPLPPEGEELPNRPELPDGTSLFVTFHKGLDLYLWDPAGEEAEAQGDASPPEPSARLKVVDPETGAGWTFPLLEGLQDLFDRVYFQHTRLKTWMRTVVEDAHGKESSSSDERARTETVNHEPVNQQAQTPSWVVNAEEPSSPSEADGHGETANGAGSADENSDENDSEMQPAQDESSPFEGTGDGAPKKDLL